MTGSSTSEVGLANGRLELAFALRTGQLLGTPSGREIAKRLAVRYASSVKALKTGMSSAKTTWS